MKNSYTVCFELFGKKMQLTDVKASTEKEAIEYVKNKIVIHSVNLNDTNVEKLFDKADSLFSSFENIFEQFNKLFK